MLGVPVPLAINTPLQKNWKSPVNGLNITKFPVLVSSCKHKGKVVTVNVHCVMLFEASVAVQVTVVVPAGKIEPDGGLQTTVVPGQLSLAAGVAKVTVLPVASGQDAAAVAAMSAGQPLGNTGAWLSLTVTVKLHIASGCTPFVAVQLTVVVPTGNVFGDVITVLPTLQVTVGAGMPVDPTVKLTDAEH